MSEIERFIKLCQVNPETGCWDWGAHKHKGYGRFMAPKSMLAHRWAYRYFVGPIPDGLELDHLCRNRACVNPDHLEAVTSAENNRRSMSFAGVNSRVTHCPQGHAYDDKNTYRYNGQRKCRLCQRAAVARYKTRLGLRRHGVAA